jgi:hypothetical protein
MVTGVCVYLPVLLILAGTGVFAMATDAHIAFFLKDAKASYDVPFHAGALSDIGVLLWCTTAVVCVFTWLVLRRTASPPAKSQFLLSAGLFTAMLMFDDLFLLHENFVPNHLGLEEDYLLLLYAVLAVALFLRYWDVIARTAYALLLLSGAFLAGSIMFDVLTPYWGLLSSTKYNGVQHLLEDGFKLFGIAGWLGYFGWTCYASLIR